RQVRIDPWSVTEPWRGYVSRGLDARRRLRTLASQCPPGPVASYLAHAVSRVDVAVEEQWALARSGAALTGPGRHSGQVTEELAHLQSSLRQAGGADRALLASREEALASELRSLRHSEAVAAQVSSQLSALCTQLESLVASGVQLVSAAATADADLGALTSELDSLFGALAEARRIMAGAPPSG
ncbi:MAG TPA: hypothetical protein VME46_06865, partial [Acidimicrobiales bacterium]|nr:hypothetical protein [Acidimicrobiales bacterium]